MVSALGSDLASAWDPEWASVLGLELALELELELDLASESEREWDPESVLVLASGPAFESESELAPDREWELVLDSPAVDCLTRQEAMNHRPLRHRKRKPTRLSSRLLPIRERQRQHRENFS